MGRSPCCIKEGLKKGPWTGEEDQMLKAFVKEHGHGNWRSLPKNCGLLRCGKSCRLRWINYLRPDIKRGSFTHSEEQKIIQLHSLVGNKWAFIASQLPKRTDNEIKNYWNTVLKKRLDKTLGTARTHSTLTPGAERLSQDTKSNIKSSASNKASYNSDMQSNVICSPAVMSCTHLAQWENARLEAEAKVSKESQPSKTHKLLSLLQYMGHSLSSSNNTTTTTAFPNPSVFSSLSHTNPQSLQQLSNFLLHPPNTFPSYISDPCLIHHPSTISYLSSLSLPMNSLSNTSSFSLPTIVPMPSSSSNIVSSKSLSSLSSKESITLGPSRRLSWQTKELSFTTSPPISSTSQSSFLSQVLCKIDRHHGHEVELNASTKGDLIRRNEQMDLEATSSMMDLNSTMVENSMDLNSTMDSWHDLIFDVENSCSDVVSTNWKEAIMLSSQREEFTHDATSNRSKSGTLECPNGQDNGSLDLEGLNLLHFDSLMSREHYSNQHSKEILWDKPPTLQG